MSEEQIGYGDVSEDKSFELVPCGTYNMELVNSTCDLQPTKGNPRLSTRWRILDGESKNRQVFKTFFFGDTSMKFNQWQLGVMGVWSELKDIKGHEDAAQKAAEIVFDMVDKLKVSGEISHNTWNDKTREDLVVKEVITDVAFDSSEEIPF